VRWGAYQDGSESWFEERRGGGGELIVTHERGWGRKMFKASLGKVQGENGGKRERGRTKDELAVSKVGSSGEVWAGVVGWWGGVRAAVGGGFGGGSSVVEK